MFGVAAVGFELLFGDHRFSVPFLAEVEHGKFGLEGLGVGKALKTGGECFGKAGE